MQMMEDFKKKVIEECNKEAGTNGFIIEFDCNYKWDRLGNKSIYVTFSGGFARVQQRICKIFYLFDRIDVLRASELVIRSICPDTPRLTSSDEIELANLLEGLTLPEKPPLEVTVANSRRHYEIERNINKGIIAETW